MFVRKIMDVESVAWMDGVKKRLIIGPTDGAPTYLMRVYEIAPGKTHPLHTHNWEHEGYVLAGEGLLVSETGEIEIQLGDAYFIAPNEKHAVINKGTNLLRILCMDPVCAYNASADLSVK